MSIMLAICIFLSLLIFNANSESSICIEKEEYSYMDSSHNMYKVREYTIVNTSNDTPYVTFIKHDDVGIGSDLMISRYFNSHHGEFNLMAMLTDNVVLVDFVPIVGETFLKEIGPNSEFKYIMVEVFHDHYGNNTISDEDIFVFKKSYIEEVIQADLNEGIFYPGDEIVVIL